MLNKEYKACIDIAILDILEIRLKNLNMDEEIPSSHRRDSCIAT